MIINILIICFVLSLIPKFRDYFKKDLRSMYLTSGIGLILVEIIMAFWVYPKLLSLYKQSNLAFDFQTNTLIMIGGFIISLITLFLGIKYVKFYKSNRKFYLMFALLIVLTYLSLTAVISTIIQPIYTLTSSYK